MKDSFQTHIKSLQSGFLILIIKGPKFYSRRKIKMYTGEDYVSLQFRESEKKV